MATTTAPEEAFQRGQAALDMRSHHEALSSFQRALDLSREEKDLSRMKYMSWFGLALTLAKGRSDEAVKLCHQAVSRNFLDPDLYCNLGIVYLRNGRKGLAFEAFRKALIMNPKHKRTLEELGRYERRSVPVLSFLSRDNLLNRLFGRIRHRVRLMTERVPSYEG